MILQLTLVTGAQARFNSKTQDIQPRLRPFKRGLLFLNLIKVSFSKPPIN